MFSRRNKKTIMWILPLICSYEIVCLLFKSIISCSKAEYNFITNVGFSIKSFKYSMTSATRQKYVFLLSSPKLPWKSNKKHLSIAIYFFVEKQIKCLHFLSSAQTPTPNSKQNSWLESCCTTVSVYHYNKLLCRIGSSPYHLVHHPESGKKVKNKITW